MSTSGEGPKSRHVSYTRRILWAGLLFFLFLFLPASQENATSDISLDPRQEETIPVNAPPDPPSNETPPDQATGIDANPELCVDVSDLEGDLLDVQFFGREVTEAAADDFTIIVLPDTQLYSQTHPSVFESQTQWIIDNQDALNIVFVTHVGDIVNVPSDEQQWLNAEAALGLLDPAGNEELMPYGLAVGNHDQPSTLFNLYLGLNRFCPDSICRSYYGGHFGTDNDNSYQLFSAGGMDFVVIHLEYDLSDSAMSPGPDDGSNTWDVMSWAEGVLEDHSDRRAIISSHFILDTWNMSGDFPPRSTQGTRLYNWFRDNENVFLMVCGHLWQAARRSDPTTLGDANQDGICDDSDTGCIHALVSDYQNLASGGNGWLRILTFSPNNDTVRVRTYSTTLDTFIEECDYSDSVDCSCAVVDNRWVCGPACDCVAHPDHAQGDTQNDFYLDYDMPGGPTFTQIGSTLTDVASGSRVCVDWPGRRPNTEYVWYVDVDDGTSVTRGPRWTFTSNGSCGSDADCVDGLFCNGTESCDTVTTFTCQPGEGDPCVASDELCDEDADACVDCLKNTDCNDENVCTDDVCIASVCSNTANTASCDDGDECTEGDVCSGGTCIGTALDCSDGNDCTDDVCADGVCTNPYNPTADCCGADGDCDDADPCTDDSCAEAPGGDCINNPVPACCDEDSDCNDGQVCTVDTCDWENSAALLLNGTSNYVAMGQAPGLGAATFTLEAWIKWNGGGLTGSSGSGGVSGAPIIAKGRGEDDGSNLDCNYFFAIDPSSGVLVADFEDMASGDNHPLTGTIGTVSAGSWHHVAVTYDGNAWAMYLDGDDHGSGTTGGATPRFDSIQHFGLGSSLNSTGSPAGFFDGLIDEVRVWNRALSQAEIQSNMYAEISSDPDLIGRWDLDENAGTTAADSTTPAEDGAIVGGTWEDIDIPNLGAGACDFTAVDCTSQSDDCGLAYCDSAGADGNCDGLTPMNEGGTCNDGDPCTEDGICTGGNCAGTQIPGCCEVAADCDDSDACTGDECVAMVSNGVSLSFDGINDYVDLGNDPSITDFGANSFTVEGWLWTTDPGQPDFAGLFRGGRRGAASQIAVQLDDGGVEVSVEDTAGHQVTTSPLAISADTWHHFAAVIDRTTNELRLYLDGGATPATADASAWSTHPIASTDNTVLGAARVSTGTLSPIYFFDGLMDEVRVWDHARTLIEIQNNMNRPLASAPGLISRWSMDDNDGGTTVYDSVASNHGALTDGASLDTGNVPDLGVTNECAYTPVVCDDSNDCTNEQCDSVTGCSYEASGVCGVSGTIHYYRDFTVGAEPSAKPVPNVDIDTSDDGGPDDTTDLTGDYAVDNLFGWFNVTTLDKFGTGGASDHNNAVTSSDASLIARTAVGLTTLSTNQEVAADVSGNGSVSSYDASLVAQFSVELFDHFNVALSTGSDWAFCRCDNYVDEANQDCTAPVYVHDPLTVSAEDDFHAILYGDVTGNWQPAGRSAAQTSDEDRAAMADRETARDLRELARTREPRTSSGPVILSLIENRGRVPAGSRWTAFVNVRNAEGIHALDLELEYDAERISIVEIEGRATGFGWSSVHNDVGGLVKIGMYGVLPLEHSGTLLAVTIEALEDVGPQDVLTISGAADEERIPLVVLDRPGLGGAD